MNAPAHKDVHNLEDEVARLTAENTALKREAATIRGVIEQLAVGMPPQPGTGFAVRGPDGRQSMVPWSWVEAPFAFVKSQMDAMQDFGTKAVRGYHDVLVLRPAAQRWEWLARRGEFHALRSCWGKHWTLTYAVQSRHGWVETPRTVVEGKTLEECVDKATETAPEIT